MESKTSGSRDSVWCVEHQMKVHYFMPFRQWGYELRQYEKQYYQISWDLKKRLKDKEFLSGVKKEQKYIPVIRLTVYWNQKEPWDGEKEITSLIKLEGVPHPYTQALLSAVPIPDPKAKKERIILEGSIPSALNPPSGCKFHTRCPKCMEICKQKVPEKTVLEEGHEVYCHLYNK